MVPPRRRPQNSRPPVPAERRSHPRHRPTRQTTCQLRTRPAGPTIKATVWNLSARGLSLVVAARFEPGTVLHVWLFNAAATCCLEAKLRVTRADARYTGDHLIAGELDRTLEPAELLAFLL